MMTGGGGGGLEKSPKFDDVIVEWLKRSLKNLYLALKGILTRWKI
jgi:hypothetical protein